MERKTIEENKNGARDYAVLVGLRSPVLGADSADEESLAELAALVETAGGESVGMILQSREKPDPHSFIGEGKVEEVKRMVERIYNIPDENLRNKLMEKVEKDFEGSMELIELISGKVS